MWCWLRYILIFFNKTISLVLSFALILVVIIDSINLHKQKRFTYEIVKRELTVLEYEIIYENPETGIISFIQDGIEKSISIYNSL